MLKLIAAFTPMTRYLHLGLAFCMMAGAFWTLPASDAATIVLIAVVGVALAYRELAQALDVLWAYAQKQESRNWPQAMAQVVRHNSYTYTTGGENIEHDAVSITWTYKFQGQEREAHTDVFGSGKTSPVELAATHFPIGHIAPIHVDPAGLAGAVFPGPKGPPSRWEILQDLPELAKRTLLYLGYLGFTAWMASRSWITY